MLIYILILLIISLIFLFSSRTLSPIPYFPTPKVDLPLIIKALKLKNNQTVIDLGAGDGIVIFEAAKKAYQKDLNTKFIGVDINPALVLIMNVRRLFHPNRRNIIIIRNDIFKMNFFHLTPNHYSLTVYLYISPWLIDKTLKNVYRQISKFSIVSYMYPIKSLRKKGEIIRGKNKIFAYN